MKYKSRVIALSLVKAFFLPLACFAQPNKPQKEYRSLALSTNDKTILKRLLNKAESNFDPKENMIVTKIDGYQYHTDATSGNYHQIRGSFYYALALLNTGDETLRPRAFSIIQKTLGLQDTLATSPTCGVWPYYLEEPLQTKKSPPDFNMADFNAVTLIEIWLGHHNLMAANLQAQLKHAILLAAYSIKKRDVNLGYTNIALMDTYVTYMAAHIFEDALFTQYSEERLDNFYDYTLSKKGFTEYNSPTYTITAMEELNRMQLYFVDAADRKKVDSMYHLCWQILARHYHAPTGQWTGPHARSYNSLVGKSFYNFLAEASGGKVFGEDSTVYNYTTFRRYKHVMPNDVVSYFTKPVYPRTEIDYFEPDTPQIIGTSFLSAAFTLSSINHASMWNQRRPLIAYWGTKESPKYLQVRFLHDNYDFSSASLSSTQATNKVLAAINFVTGLGDKHITIDKIKDGIFTASDLRLRFEFGNTQFDKTFMLPSLYDAPFVIKTPQLDFTICLFQANLDNQLGYWEKGNDGKTAWIDFVFYKGIAKQFDMNKLQKAIAAFSLMITDKNNKQIPTKPSFRYEGKKMKSDWQNLSLTVDTDVRPVGKHAGWF